MDPFSLVRSLQLAAAVALLPAAALAQTGAPTEPNPLNAVRRELSPDALFYTYIDFEGGWGQVGRELSDTLKASSFADKPIDLPGAFEAIGLSQIRAIGLSSDAVPGGYDNRFFLYTPTGRAGVFSLFPGKPQPFQAAQFAPADADLVLDLRLDLPALIKTVESVAVKFTGEKEVADELLKLLAQSEEKGLTELIAYQGRAIVIVRMHPQDQIERRAAEFSFKLPFDVFARIETGGKHIAKTLAADSDWLREEKNGRTYFTRKPTDDVPPEDFAIILDGDSIAIASTPFSDECLAKTGALAADPAYLQALADSASEGHVLFYMTPKFFTSVRNASKMLFLTSSFASRSYKDALIANQLMSMLPMIDKPLTSVLVARDDGILIRGRSIESLKASLPAVSLLTPDFLGRIATYAAKAWVIDDARRHETERAQKEFAPQLQQVGEAAQKFFAANPEAESVTLTALKAALPNEKLPDFSTVSSTEVEVLRASDIVILEHNTLGSIQHLMPITNAQRATIEKNLRAIDGAALESMLAEGSGYAYAGTLIDAGWIEPKPISLLGEDYTSVSPTLTEPRLTITTRGNQEIAITREPKALAQVRRSIAERQLHVERNLAKAHEAARRYFEASPEEYAVSFDDLAKKDLKPELTPIIGENYSDLSFTRDSTSTSLTHPRFGRVIYTEPPSPKLVTALRERLQKLERAASAYFAKNPKAELVVSGEIYEDPVPAIDTATHDDAAMPVVSTSDAPTSAATPDLSALVIRRDYETIKASLESGYEVTVPRTKPKR
ncbi:hypothetical protein [Nibricoccus aquaticus]|nr:hypothetical protein [Nibricoccus aquaticus]